jgi:hypothetical protein
MTHHKRKEFTFGGPTGFSTGITFSFTGLGT